MQDLKDVFARIGEQKKERKRVKAIIDEALKQSKEWTDATEEIKQMKAKRKLTEDAILSGYQAEVETLDRLKASIDADQTMLSDIALSMMMKGETVKLETDAGEWEPKIKITFRQLSLF